MIRVAVAGAPPPAVAAGPFAGGRRRASASGRASRGFAGRGARRVLAVVRASSSDDARDAPVDAATSTAAAAEASALGRTTGSGAPLPAGYDSARARSGGWCRAVCASPTSAPARACWRWRWRSSALRRLLKLGQCRQPDRVPRVLSRPPNGNVRTEMLRVSLPRRRFLRQRSLTNGATRTWTSKKISLRLPRIGRRLSLKRLPRTLPPSRKGNALDSRSTRRVTTNGSYVTRCSRERRRMAISNGTRKETFTR